MNLKNYNVITMPIQIELLKLNLNLLNEDKKNTININKNIIFFADRHTPMEQFRPLKNEMSVPGFLYTIMKYIKDNKINKCIDIWIENHINKKNIHDLIDLEYTYGNPNRINKKNIF